jgi:hypothetical protein
VLGIVAVAAPGQGDALRQRGGAAKQGHGEGSEHGSKGNRNGAVRQVSGGSPAWPEIVPFASPLEMAEGVGVHPKAVGCVILQGFNVTDARSSKPFWKGKVLTLLFATTAFGHSRVFVCDHKCVHIDYPQKRDNLFPTSMGAQPVS